MKRGVLGLFSLIIASSFQASAQQSVIEVVSDITMLCNCEQVEDGDIVSYKYSIHNKGNAALLVPYVYWNGNGYSLVGTFDTKMEVSNISFPSNPVSYSWINDDEHGVDMGIYDPVSKQKIDYVYPGDTAVVVIEDEVIMSSRHREGNNTIVVWPENYDGITVRDTLQYEIEVINTSGQAIASGIDNPWFASTNVYPNPANSHVSISIPEELQKELKSISIMNALGQEVKSFDGSYLELNIDELSNGHYTIGFNLSNQSSFSKPIVVKK